MEITFRKLLSLLAVIVVVAVRALIARSVNVRLLLVAIVLLLPLVFIWIPELGRIKGWHIDVQTPPAFVEIAGWILLAALAFVLLWVPSGEHG